MDYSWRHGDEGSLVLVEVGSVSNDAPLPLMQYPAAIHKVGPFLVGSSDITFQATGIWLNSPETHDSLEGARASVEVAIRAAGHTVDGI